jgi:hypothetical protein
MRNEEVVAYYKLLCQDWPGGTQEDHESVQSRYSMSLTSSIYEIAFMLLIWIKNTSFL